jgi:CheY-like chemotaxis protein/HPt (histidine-containing phosphotransfer) domain-containing protein
VANNGQQALESLQERDFDVVLMDVQMPIMDGFLATHEIRRLPDKAKARVPIIAMTAHALKGDQERCLAAGMDGYISKPVKGEELIDLVEQLAQQHGKFREDVPEQLAEDHLSGDTMQSASDKVFDLTEAVNHCSGNYDLFTEMVEYLFEEADPLLQRMRAAYAAGNAEEVGKAAHRLKGTVLYLSAQPLLNAAVRLEEMGRKGNIADAAAAIEHLARELEALKTAIAVHRR